MKNTKWIVTLALWLTLCSMAWAQSLRTKPTILPEGNSFDDKVTITCDFPEGCHGGKYWINGGELQAQTYTEPFVIDYSCALSVAGVNKDGRIITDVVTRDIQINRVSAPSVSVSPKEGIRKESFYVTSLTWENVTRTDLLVDDFKTGGSRNGEFAIWLTNKRGQIIAANDYNGLWMDGLNRFKAYLYENYQVILPGIYTLHIANGVFKLDGVIYDEELQFQYEVATDISVPVFTPESGEYYAPLTVSIEYPTDGSAFYQFYKINGEKKAKSYTGPITITETSTIEAYGMDENFESQTDVASATYTIIEAPKGKEVLPTPVISRSGNTISISAQADATLKYWMNDDMNTAAIYTSPITVSENVKISAVAYTDNGLSTVADLVISNFPVDRGDMGEQVLITPSGLESIHVRAISGNGRWATGFVGSDTSSKGFIWDLTADQFQLQSAIFVNQLYDIADDGTAYGWRLTSTEVDEDMTDEDILWGICKESVWTAQPEGMTVNGITPDGKLYGSYKNRPATYDFATNSYEYCELPDGGISSGQVTAVSKESGLLGGYVVNNGHRYAIVWEDHMMLKTFAQCTETREQKVTAISDNGEWAIIGQDYRVNLKTGSVEKVISMSSRYHNDINPEVLTTIADDGTVFGTYDASLQSRESGLAMVYTTDHRWRNLTDWMVDEKGSNLLSEYNLTSVRATSADHNLLVLHGRTKGISSDDSFTRGIALKINVPVAHLAPVSVKAQQIPGLETIKVSWSSPITHADEVKAYSISRNGVKLGTVDASELTYYDTDIKSGETYSYTVSATYSDGKVSDESDASTISFKLQQYNPVRNIEVRQSGLDDINLTWDAPVVGLPKLQYFNEESEWMAFGTANNNAEFGIRIAASDLSLFQGQQIRTFQFLPTGPQNGYTLNLYRGKSLGGKYEPEPFYSQTIDPASLNYGVVNVIELDTPQELPLGTDLYVGLLVESAGNDNMLGVSYEGFKSGYTDLCRIVGVFQEMLPISQNSSQTTEIVLPMGLGICSESNFNRNMVSNYSVTIDQQPAATTSDAAFRYENLSEGAHTFSIEAIYRDGVASEAKTQTIDLKLNEAAYVSVSDVTIDVDADHKATFTWSAPLEDDCQLIHWGDFEARPGLPVQEVFSGYLAAAIYPVTMTKMYANAYQITELFFHPLTADASFEIMLTDMNGMMYADVMPESVVPGQLNYVKLPEPVTIDQSVSYMVSVSVSDVYLGTSPLAYDSSNKWQNGYSNIFDYGMGMGNLSEIVQANEHPNWILGMVVRQQDATPMPLLGYNVSIDGKTANSALLNACTFTTEALSEGSHQASVDVVYTQTKTVSGAAQNFIVGESSAIEQLNSATADSEPAYDLTGRRVISDRSGRSLFVISGKKIKANL